MKIREKILRIGIYLTGLICLYVWIAARSLPVMNLMQKEVITPEYWEFTKWGEMYYFNHIKYFREKNLPHPMRKYRFSDKHPTLVNADIIIFGDSFFDFSRQKTFPERLSDTLQKRVYYERYFYPLVSFNQKNFSNDSLKLFIYEIVERDIPDRFQEPLLEQINVDNRNITRKKAGTVKDWIFRNQEEEIYNKMLKGNILTTDIYGWIATVKFDLFKFISPLTPKYYLGDTTRPWLFYYKQLNDENSSFYYHHSDEEIETYCNNIADLAHKLKVNYDLDFLFIPIPNKYTIYHTLINNDEYNELLPRIYASLEKKGVPVVKLYDDFLNAKEVLYYGTDTHWNKRGIDIALRKTLEKLNKNGELIK